MNELNLSKSEGEPKKGEPTLTDVVVAICDAYDWEIIRLKLRKKANEEDHTADRIISWSYEKYMSVDYSMFFTLDNLKKTTEEIFRDAVLRTFILNLTERVSNNLAMLPSELVTQFEGKIVTAIEKTRINPAIDKDRTSMIIEDILMSYAVDKDFIEPLLKDNMWLMILHQLLLNLHTTVTYKELVNSMKQMKSPIQPT